MKGGGRDQAARPFGSGEVVAEDAAVDPLELGDLLGLDPLYVANEGKLVCICNADDADTLLAVMRAHPLGSDAARIGTVIDDDANLIQMKTGFGGTRVVDWLAGEQLPRIC